MTVTTENESTPQTIESLQQSYSNIKIFTAVPMGVAMILYFFTFAMFIDKGMNGALLFEIITSILFVLYFIFINQAAFVILKLFNRNKPKQKELLSLMTASDLTKSADALSDVIASRRV